jgi:hypothetical protein
MTPADAQQAFADLGVYPRDITALQTMPFQAAVARLTELKAIAKKNFRNKALELHPDLTGNDPVKAQRFVFLKKVFEDLNGIALDRRPSRPVPMDMPASRPFPTGPISFCFVVDGRGMVTWTTPAGVPGVPIQIVIIR